MAYYTVQDSPQVVADILGGADREFYGKKSVSDIRERFGHEGRPVFSSFVITNNIEVALRAFALGITFGVGTIYELVVNGAMVGGVAGAVRQERSRRAVLDGDSAPSGAVELSAIVVAGGAGLLLGYGLWARVSGRDDGPCAKRPSAPCNWPWV